MVRLPRIFYGWWILVASSFITALVGAINVYGFSLFIVPLTTEFGWTRTMLSGAISLARLEGGLLGPLEGFLVDKFGPRRMMLLGIPVLGFGFIALGQLSVFVAFTGLESIAIFYVVYIVMISLGGALGTFTPATTAVANWFVRRRGITLGLLSSGFGVGAMVATPILGQAIQTLGWRPAAVGAGLAVLIIGIPAALVIRHRPEQYGMQPDGDPPAEEEQPLPAAVEPESHASSQRRHGGDRKSVEQDFTIRQALATLSFWILAVTFSLRIMVSGAVALHLAPLLIDMGMTTAEAGGALSLLAGISIAGRLGFGWLGDRHDKKVVLIGGLATMVMGLLVLAYATEFWHIVLFLLLYSPSYGGLASLMPTIRGEFFGRKSFATIGGAMGPITTLGTISGPVFAGYVFDTTGSYQIAMLVFAAGTVVALVLTFFLKRPEFPGSIPEVTTASAPAPGRITSS